MADDYGSTASTAGALSVGGQVTGKLEVRDDRDWFSVTLAAGTTYWFELSGKTAAGVPLSYPVLKLFDANGNGVVSGLFDANGVASVAFTPATAGTYYVQARQQSAAVDSSYTLRALVAPGQDDYRDDVATTGRLTVGGQATGNFEVLGDRDSFRVELVAGTTYAFELLGAKQSAGTADDSSGSRFSLRLSDAGGVNQPMDSRASNNDTIVHTVTAKTTGFHYLSAAPTTSVGTYAVKAELAATQANPSEIAVNDLFLATAGDDTFDGGGGIDRVIFSGPKSDYVIVRPFAGLNSTVTGKGTDRLVNIERVEFADVGVAFDLSGNAGKVLWAMRAIMGTGNVTTNIAFIGDGLRKLDSGMSYEAYVQQNLDAVLGPDPTSEQVVTLLYKNVTRRDPPEKAMAYYTSLLDDGVVTTAWLGAYAASHLDNVIALVGSEKSGLTYAF